MKIYKTRSGSPYLPNGKTRFNLRDVPGCYIIYSGSEIAYIGSGGNCYKTFYRHFQDWSRSKQRRVLFSKYSTSIRARMIYTKTRQDAYDIEQALLLKFPTMYNNNQINFEPTKDEIKLANNVLLEDSKPIIIDFSKTDLPF